MTSRIQFPTQGASDTTPYELFLTLTPAELMSLGATRSAKSQREYKNGIAYFIRRLPGFVEFYGGDEWISRDDLGCLAMFANTTYAASAMLDIERTYGALVANASAVNDASAEKRLDAATVAFKHTPSATHFARLTRAMLDLQSERYNDIPR